MGLGALIHFVRECIHKYLYFSKATICIQGLVLSHSFVNHVIMSILITYLQNNWVHEHFQIAAVVTNVQEGLAGILVIVLAHFSHGFKGALIIIATTNAAYILGLSLLWLPNEYKSEDYAAMARIFYGAVVLLTLGESGRSAALKEFLNKQCLSKHEETGRTDDRPEGWEEASEQKEITAEKHTEAGGDQQVTKETAERDKKDFWGVPWFLGAVVPLFLFETTWTQIFMISTIAMAVSYLLFWFGFNDYLKNNKESQAGEHPQVTERENLCTLNKKVRKKKRLRKEIVASWLAFFVYSMVQAAGSTFFFEQISNLENPIPNYDPAVYFNVLSSFSKYIISFLFPKVIPKRTRVRIGCGMASTMLCCVAAWVVEIHRIRKVTRAGLEDDTLESTISMSMFWLVPQFFLLGLMEGLAVDGLIDLLADRVDEKDKEMAKYYGSHTSDLVVGTGKLLTALIIFAFRKRWFNDSINRSRLDKYYRLLTFLSLGSFVYYLCVGFYFYSKDDTENSAIEEHEQGHNGSGKYGNATV